MGSENQLHTSWMHEWGLYEHSITSKTQSTEAEISCTHHFVICIYKYVFLFLAHFLFRIPHVSESIGFLSFFI